MDACRPGEGDGREGVTTAFAGLHDLVRVASRGLRFGFSQHDQHAERVQLKSSKWGATIYASAIKHLHLHASSKYIFFGTPFHADSDPLMRGKTPLSCVTMIASA